MSEEEVPDLSQLMAFADSLDVIAGFDFADIDVADRSPRVDLSDTQQLTESVDWFVPPKILSVPKNGFEEVIGEVRGKYDSIVSPLASPDSPVQRSRTALFNVSEKPLELQLCGDGLDPRSVYVMDHPGRLAQFKHWQAKGLVADDSRRSTIRDESNRACCWGVQQQTNGGVSQLSDLAGGIRAMSGNSVLGLILSTKQGGASSAPGGTPEEMIPGTSNSLVEALRRSLATPTASSFNTTPELAATPPLTSSNHGWNEKCFMMGKQLMVAMNGGSNGGSNGGPTETLFGQSKLSDSMFPSWCMWFNDKLCAWGLSDKLSFTPGLSFSAPIPSVSPVFADIDFSRNNLSDSSIAELVQLLSAFRRVKVKTLRLSHNSISDEGLALLENLPYLQQLYVDGNNLTCNGIVDFVSKLLRNKRDYYDGLVAQDAADEAVVKAVTVSVEDNYVFDPLTNVLAFLEQQEGIVTCNMDATGCDPNSICRVYETKCNVHFSGLGCQKLYNRGE